MANYTVAFEVNGSVREITCTSTKVGNRYLQCFGNVNGDSEKVAFIPFDSVAYIVHDSISLGTAADSTQSAEPTDAAPVELTAEDT